MARCSLLALAVMLWWVESDGQRTVDGADPKKSGTGNGAQTSPAGIAPLRLLPAVEEALCWLPEDTESLRVARGPIGFSWRNDFDHDFREEAVFRNMALFGSTASGFVKKHIEPHEAELIFASYGQREPNQKMYSLTPGCQIIVFRNEVAATVMKVAAPYATRVHEVRGRQIIEVEDRVPPEYSVFLVQAKPNVLVVATNLNYLSTLIRRIGTQPASRALPATLREWQLVDTNAQVWGVRHYQRSRRSLGTMLSYDREGAGIVFWYDKGRESSIVLRYISPVGDSGAKVRQAFEDHYDMIVAPRRVANDAVEVIVGLDRAGPTLRKSARLSPMSACDILFCDLF